MTGAKRIVCLTGLCLLLGGLMGSPAGAAEPNAAPSDDTGPLPAVDGLNANVSGFGGAADGNGFYGGAGSVTVPLGYRYGLQIDAVAAGFDSRFQGNVTVAGTAAHLFWRDPTRGLFGLYGHYLHADAFSGVDVYAGAVEAALYRGRFTLEAVAGVQGGKADLGVLGSVNIDTRFFDVAQLAYYPIDNLKLSIGHSYAFGNNSALIGAEWGLPTGGGTMASLFVRGSVSESGDGAVLGGLRLYFGQRDKTLMRRHREDDPTVVIDPNTGTFTYSPYLSPPGFLCLQEHVCF
jgi:hypothetical protein